MPRTSRYGFPYGFPRQQESFTEIFAPTLGLHAGEPPHDLSAGFTPASRNFVPDAGWLTPRSGLSRFGTSAIADAMLGGAEVFDVFGLNHAVAASAATVQFMHRDIADWSARSYVPVSGASVDAPSGTSRNYWETAFVYDAAEDENMVVLTNDQNLPKLLYPYSSFVTYSDFSFVISQFSQARTLAAFDNRLVWANLRSTESDFPQRVLWSVRGGPASYDLTLGAGFEDLLDMRGEITRIVPVDDGLIIFGDEEIWQARKRSDAFVFDFFPLTRQLGCPYPRTVARVPGGIVFLARDNEVYMLVGANLIPLGISPRRNPRQDEASRIAPLLAAELREGERAWAMYDQSARRYMLFYPASDTTLGYPTRALFYSFDNASWFQQHFSHELSFGFDYEDPGAGATWDSFDTTVTWDDLNVTWDGIGSGGTARAPIAFGSGGTAYRFRSDHTSDDGTAIDARWRSHALGQRNTMRYDQLHEVWFDHQSPSASSLSVMVSDNLGATFIDGIEIALSASSLSEEFAPVWITAQAPMFELRLNDGGRPRIGRMQAHLRDSGTWKGRL